MEVNVQIGAILLHCDESIENLNIGRNYNIHKEQQDNLFFLTDIVDGSNRLSTDYYTSRIIENNEESKSVSFMCLSKEEVLTLPDVEIKSGVSYTDRDFDMSVELDAYKDKEFEYLNTIISLLQVFKKGNIGIKKIFFRFTYRPLGFITNRLNPIITIEDANIITEDIFKLTEEEVEECNIFIHKYYTQGFSLMERIINEYTFGLKQIDLATGFEQFTTVLEMILLKENSPGKKEMLSKRTAALLGTNNPEITEIYSRMKEFYKFRSESLHEGNDENITPDEFIRLENITRRVIKKYLEYCFNSIENNSSITWAEIKDTQITRLISEVGTLIEGGCLPK